MSEKTTSTDTKQRYFLYNHQYPDITTILHGEQIDLADFCKDALFVFDTNSLLVPYLVGQKGLEEITRIYKEVLDNKKIFIASHSLREFAKNRSSKISELFTEVDKALSLLPGSNSLNYPILGGMEEYKVFSESREEMQKAVSKHKKSLQALQAGINNWNWFDPVTSLYSEVFKPENIIEVSDSEENLLKEFLIRMESDIPPGNKDKTKSDNAIGDFLIWKCILEIATKKKKNLVFVTNDEKNDWMLKGNTKSISPRFELVDEFFRVTKQRFTCINFADFLNLQGALEEVVSEVGLIVDETEKSSDFSVLNSLSRISTILRRFLSYANDNVGRDDIYIEDESIYQLINDFTSNFERNYNLKTNSEKSTFYEIIEVFSKIKSLNSEINYQAVRQKRSTFDQQRKLVQETKVAIALISELLNDNLP